MFSMKTKIAANAVVFATALMISMTGCTSITTQKHQQVPDLTAENSYVNYNNQTRARMHIEDNTIFLTYEDDDSEKGNHLFSVGRNGQKEIAEGLPEQFVKSGSSIYYQQSTANGYRLMKTDTLSGKNACLMDNADAFLVYGNSVLSVSENKLMLSEQFGKNVCLTEGRFEFITANENAAFAVDSGGTVWEIDVNSHEIIKTGAFSNKEMPFDVAASNLYIVARFWESDTIAVLNIVTGKCRQYKAPSLVRELTAGRNDVAYFVSKIQSDTEKCGLYRIDLASGAMVQLADHLPSECELYIYDDEWVYVADSGFNWRFSVEDIERVSTDGERREHIYSVSANDIQ